MNEEIIKRRIVEESLKEDISNGDMLLVDNQESGTSRIPASLLDCRSSVEELQRLVEKDDFNRYDWERTGYYATGLRSSELYNYASTGIISSIKYVNVAMCVRCALLLYKERQYVGKINSSGDVDKIAGDWKYYSGEQIDIVSILEKHDCDGFALDVTVPPGYAYTITDENYVAIVKAFISFSDNTFTTKENVVFGLGRYYADGFPNPDVSAATAYFRGGAVLYLSDNAYAWITVFKDGVRIGKYNERLGIDSVAEDWNKFEGSINLFELMQASGSDELRVSVHPSDGTVLTVYNISEWISENCIIFESIDEYRIYVESKLDNSSTSIRTETALSLIEVPVQWINSYAINLYSGEPELDSTKFISSFIPVPPNSLLKLVLPDNRFSQSDYFSAIYKYDSNKAYIERERKAWVRRKEEYCLFDDCAYIRIAVVNSDYRNPVYYYSHRFCKVYYCFNTLQSVLQEMKVKLFENSKRITALEGGIPAYWTSHLNSVITTVNGRHGDQYIFITDLHINAGNSGRYGDLIDYVLKGTNVNKIICGGDMFTGNSSLRGRDAELFIRECASKLSRNPLANYYYVVGNHDRGVVYGTGDDASTNTISKYDLFTNCGIRNTPHVHYDRQNQFRYYFDNDEYKVRYVIVAPTEDATVDDGSYQLSLSENNNWLYTCLLSLPESYNAVVISHIIWNQAYTEAADFTYGNMLPWNQDICDVITAYNNKASVTCHDGNTYNFTNAKGNKVLLHHGGHSHNDARLIYNNVPVVVTTCDSYAQQVPYGLTGRDLGNTSENAFDIVTIDTDNKKVYLDRIGYGESREFDLSML